MTAARAASMKKIIASTVLLLAIPLALLQAQSSGGPSSSQKFQSVQNGYQNTIPNEPVWGSLTEKCKASPASGCIVGEAYQPNTSQAVFPTAVTGWGLLTGPGSEVDGVYGQCDIRLSSGGGSCAGGEFDSFNYSSAPSATLPPNLAIGTGTVNPMALVLSNGGTRNSLLAMYVGPGPELFLDGVYVNSAAIKSGGYVYASGVTGTPCQFCVDTSGNLTAASVNAPNVATVSGPLSQRTTPSGPCTASALTAETSIISSMNGGNTQYATIRIPQFTCTGSSPAMFTLGNALPAVAVPARTQNFAAPIKSGGVTSIGCVTVTASSQAVTIASGTCGTFAASGPDGLLADITITYQVK
jgi:hypothetical protein